MSDNQSVYCSQKSAQLSRRTEQRTELQIDAQQQRQQDLAAFAKQIKSNQGGNQKGERIGSVLICPVSPMTPVAAYREQG